MYFYINKEYCSNKQRVDHKNGTTHQKEHYYFSMKNFGRLVNEKFETDIGVQLQLSTKSRVVSPTKLLLRLFIKSLSLVMFGSSQKAAKSHNEASNRLCASGSPPYAKKLSH